jgi:peptidoglycan/xylan/chitin deacetylase (PgdA/CDA1 family)
MAPLPLRPSHLASLLALLGLGAACADPAAPPPESPSSGAAAGDAATDAMCPWPSERAAAVSLTYDDGMPSQLATAVPQLEAAGLRATFFLNRKASDTPFRALLERGHELGAHTQDHPCPAATGVPGTPLEDYDLSSFATELDADVAQLRALGAPEPYSFAYPCGATWVGPTKDSVLPLIGARFAAARTVGSGEASADTPLLEVPGRFDLATLSALEGAVDRAIERGGWLVLGFHGVGGDWLVTDAAVHESFLAGLAARSEVWVAPFGEVAACVARASH